MSALITARNLDAGYGGIAVVSRVDLTVRRGERWFLVGPNGSGKTTLLRSLLGSLPPVRGGSERHASIGYVAQLPELTPLLALTTGEYVRMGLAGVREPRVKPGEALAEVGLEGFERHDFFRLSGGQRRRALLARALVRRPELLALDEPTANLDEEGEEAFFALIAKRAELTLLVATHHRAAAERYATHVLRLEHGRAELEVRG